VARERAREVVVEGKGSSTTTEVRLGPHRLTGDIPAEMGGTDKGPNPYDLLLAALGTCTAMAVTGVALRKGWPVESVRVTLNHDRVYATDCAECETKEGLLDKLQRVIEIEGPLTDEQRGTLFEMAQRCPVSTTLRSEIWIESLLKPPVAT
jgi:putative redox protein